MIQGLFDPPELQEFDAPHTSTITTRSFATSTGTQDVDVAQFFFGIAVRCLLRIDIRRFLKDMAIFELFWHMAGTRNHFLQQTIH